MDTRGAAAQTMNHAKVGVKKLIRGVVRVCWAILYDATVVLLRTTRLAAPLLSICKLR